MKTPTPEPESGSESESDPEAEDAQGHLWEPRDPTPHLPDSDEEDGYQEVHFAGIAAGADPRTFKQAMSCPDAYRWREAAVEEVNTLMANGTWEIVDLPPGKKAIGSGWVFKVKRNADGSVERYKGRVVAKGCSQRPGVDFKDLFSPTPRPPAIRLVLALAGMLGHHLRSVDISNAFTNGDLEEEIYMLQPEGFHEGGPNKVCRLKKSLYGLKQAARQWNKKLHSVLTGLGYKRLDSDRSLYLYVKGELRITVPVYIDDITLSCPDPVLIDRAVEELSKHFKLRDLVFEQQVQRTGVQQSGN